MMARIAGLAVFTAVGIAFWAHTGLAQSTTELDALRKDIEALKQGQTAIQKDLEEIKNLLRARPTATAPPAGPPPESIVRTDGAPFKGKQDAKVTLVDSTDYQ